MYTHSIRNEEIISISDDDDVYFAQKISNYKIAYRSGLIFSVQLLLHDETRTLPPFHFNRISLHAFSEIW